MRKKLLKRTAAVAISAAMLFSTAPMTTAFAANGPMGEYTTEWGETLHLAWITFNDYQLDENGKIVNDQYGWGNVTSKYNVYAEEKTDNEALAGATYDKATNTLTLNNLKNKSLQLVTNVMGDDFTINVVGDCELMEIRIWGDSHGGSLKITGDGTLTVNSYKNYDAAITLYAENTDATLNFDESVNVKLYGKEKAAAIIGSLHTDTKTGITFANGQSTDAVKAEKYIYEVREMVETIEIGDSKWKEGDLAASEDDPDGIYAIATYWYVDDDNNPTSDTLHSVKEFVYDEQRGVYLQDTGFGTLNDLTDEELKNSKFSFIYDTENYGKEIAYHNADTPVQNEYSSYYTIYQVNVPDDPQGVYGTSGHLEGKYINSSTIYHLAKDEQTEEYYEDKELDYTENSLNRSEFLASDFAYVYDESEKPVLTVVNAIQTVISTVFNTIKTVVSNIMNGISSTVSSIWNNIKNTVSNVVGGIKDDVSNAFNNILSGIKNAMSNVYNAVKGGFDNVKNFMGNLASEAFNWGKDLISGIVNGINNCIGWVTDAASNVGNAIRSFLHFSVPDEGPLTDYESWMPDFMKGLAKGIENSRGMIKSAMKNVSADMVVNPHAEVTATASDGGVSQTDLTELITAIKGAVSGGTKAGAVGDIVIPVYVGGTMLDEIIVNAQQRANLRSGGR